jgi:VIT1/CCC1 family predicted Fe2+/Mn2+ transporter/rubrerythrin
MGEEGAKGRPAAGRGDLARWRANLRDELEAAWLYESLAAAEKNPDRSQVFRDLAAVERGHAARWAEKLEAAGAAPPPAKPGLKARLLAFLARRSGSKGVVPVLLAMERSADGSYAGQADAKALGMDRQERIHAKVFASMEGGGASSGIAEQESWHRSSGGGSLRAAVFGLNDGLVSNFSLMMGVAGAAPGRGVVLLTGVAGMLAGAFSMAAGEYISVRSQRELYEREIAQEEEELAASPEEERKELELIYRAKGIPREEAAQLARSLLGNASSALDTLAREELGLDPGELGSPWTAASSSFVAFVAGALIPLLPFLAVHGSWGTWLSAGVSAAALFGVGALLSIFTGKSALYSGFRMAAIGSLVALVTNTLGRIIGVSLD